MYFSPSCVETLHHGDFSHLIVIFSRLSIPGSPMMNATLYEETIVSTSLVGRIIIIAKFIYYC